MRDVEPFARAIGVERPWLVRKVALDEERHNVTIDLDFERGAKFACAICGRDGHGE